MANEELLDLRREEIFAPANHHIFEPTHDVDIALRIHSCQVAGVQPALRINRLGGLLRHVVVALHHKEATTPAFTSLSTYHSPPLPRVHTLPPPSLHLYP